MTTFAKSTFNSAIYALARPTYPAELFDYVFAFHRQGSRLHPARWERAVDLGCGTGQATTHLLHFDEVVGVDPSKGMLDKARDHVSKNSELKQKSPVYEFVQGSSEDLSHVLSDESVDLLVAAQSCHWFDWNKVWHEASRVLRPGGSAAFWVYTEFRLTHFPTLTPLITEYAQGSDPATSVGPYFQRPGRTILERYLVDVPEPSAILGGDTSLQMQRVYFCDSDIPAFLPKEAPKHPILLRRTMTWRDLLGYFRTWSALYSYQEKNPDDLKVKDDERFLRDDIAATTQPQDDLLGGDISIRFWKDLRQGASEISTDARVGVNDEVEVHWPLALLLVRKN